MRLTLRTLLAYADDILEPAQAREIGQKLQESEVARGLLERIKEVVRRRRLGAPEVSGPDMGLDPNTVAEYLDNTLSPASVADIERICLESDLHLAEVAASHQILTLVLGEPVNVPEERRERVYALGPLTKAPQLEAAVSDNGAKEAPSSSSEFESKLPDYLREDYERRNSMLRKVLPFVAIGLIACLWFALVFFDPTLNPFGGQPADPGSEQVAANTPGDAGGAGQNGGPGNVEPKPEENEGPTAGVGGNTIGAGEPVVPEIDGGTSGLPSGEGINPPPPEEEPGTGEGDPVEVAVVPGGSPAAGEGGENVPEPGVGDPEPADTAQPMPVATGLVYEGLAGVLVHAVDEKEMVDGKEVVVTRWKLLPNRSVVHADEPLACPEPFESSLVVPRLLKIDMLGGTRLLARATPEGAVASFELQRGRVVVERAGADDPGQPVDCEIVVHGRRYALRLEPGTRCGIAVESTDRNGFPLGPTGYEQPFDPKSRPAALYVVKGQCQLVALDLPPRPNPAVPQGGRSVVLRQPNFAVSLMPDEWTIQEPEGVPLLPLPAAPVMPDWLAGGRRLLSTPLRLARTQFDREFGLADTVRQSIEPIMKDDNPDIAMYAVRTMDLIGAEDALVNALAMAPHAEAREAAVVGLRTWMSEQTPEEVAATFQEEFPRYFPEKTAEDVYRLLWGFDADDARDLATSQKLVGWLNDEEEAVRHLAFFHVQRLTGRDFDYQPNERADMRESSVSRWVRYVNETGALLPPAPVAP